MARVSEVVTPAFDQGLLPGEAVLRAINTYGDPTAAQLRTAAAELILRNSFPLWTEPTTGEQI